jgi:hypothetical protein
MQAKFLEENPKGRRPLGKDMNADVMLVSTGVLNKWPCEYVKWLRLSNGGRQERALNRRDERISQYLTRCYVI